MTLSNPVEELKARIDIVEVIGHYLPLKRVGSNYRTLCPFHGERTPSFYVSPSKQIYHCFGCGAGGDAIKFVMEYEKVEYWDALEKIASLYNIKLETPRRRGGGGFSPILEKVGELYRTFLNHPLPENALAKTPMEYLTGRGLKPAIIEQFQIGYAPDRELQLKEFRRQGFNFQELERLGVLVKGNWGYYPRLTDRIIFPIHSPKGKIIAFGGRTLLAHPAKYINFTNTPIFNKSRTFYGLHLARKQAVRKKRIIIVEGYMDVIALHQVGLVESVATLGTALTKLHLPQLHRLESQVIIAYDGDSAGRSSALKGAMLLYREGFEGGVVLFQNGKDPADLVREGVDLLSYFQKPVRFEQFIVEGIVAKYNLTIGGQRRRAYRELIGYLESLEPVLREPIKMEMGRFFPEAMGVILSSIPFSNSNSLPPGTNSITTPNIRENNFNSLPFGELDLGEASIIKTLLQNPQMIDWAIEVLPPSALFTHSRELEAIYTRTSIPQLDWIEMNNEVFSLTPKEFQYQVRILLLRYYRFQLQKLLQLPLPLEEKSKKLRELNYIIQKLRQGEFIW